MHVLIFGAGGMLGHCVVTHCRAVGTRLVQLSTDYVFTAYRSGYCETNVPDSPDPPDVSGRSKLLGKLTTQGC